MKKILIADGSPLVSAALAALFVGSEEFAPPLIENDLSKILPQVQANKPALLILEIYYPKGRSGLEILKDLRVEVTEKVLPILFLASQPEDLFALRCLRAGANGYLMKSTATPAEFFTAINTILNREPYLSPKMRKVAVDVVTGKNSGSPIETLSDRELEVFHWIGQGTSTKEIAEKLNLSPKTVATYKSHLKEKLRLGSSSGLLQYATTFDMMAA